MASDGGAKKPHFTSPLTGGHCDLIRTIRAAHIVDLYQDEYQIDVTPYLGTDEIELFRCNDTGYEFFLPFSAEGPPAFYSDLYSDERNTDWTYQATKWEYSAAAAHVPNHCGLLDIGCDGEDNLTLNMPPHHMGRWGRDSLKSLASVFEVDLVSIEYEPLQTHNFNWYQSVMEAKYLPSARWKRSLFYRFGFNEMFRSFVAEQSQTILGHTIMAVYKKKLTVTPSP